MKDFREPYKNSDHEGKYFPDQKTFEHGGNTKDSFGGFIKTLIFISAISGAIIFYFNIPKNESKLPERNEEVSDFTSIEFEVENWLDERMSLISSTFDEIYLAFNESNKKIVDLNLESSNLPEEESDSVTYGSIIEYSLVPSGKDTKVYGIIENVTDKVLGQMKVSVSLPNNSTKFYEGNTINAFTLPGERVPFEIRVSGWDGNGELQFYAEGNEFYNKNIKPVNVSFSPGTWSKTKYTMAYKTNFINKTNSIISFPQIIIVLRDKNGSILGVERKYLATDKEKYKIPALKSFPVQVDVYFSKEIPYSTDVFFSYLPL